jgi:hypothetical protein
VRGFGFLTDTWSRRVRHFVIALVVVGGLVIGGAPVSAEPSENANREVSGPFSGTSFFSFSTMGCSLVYQAFDLTYESEKSRSGTFHADTCGELGTPPTVTGSFMLTTPHGATLAGAVDGTICFGCPGIIDPTAVPFVLTLTAAEGTKGLQHVTGTIVVDGTWNILAGTIAGTVEGSLER